MIKYPKHSLAISALIWLLIFILAGISFEKINQVIQVDPTLDISSSFISESPVHTEIREKSSLIKKPAENVEQTTKASEAITKDLKALYHPLPEIPDELKHDAYQSFAVARFLIRKDGSATPEIITPTSNPKLNYLLLESLKKWQFEPSDKERVQTIRIEFRVE